MIIHDLEQGTDEWHRLRAGMPTASEFSKLVTSKGEYSKSIDQYALTLAGELYAGKPLDRFDGNQWTERGHELEGQARSDYEFSNSVEVVQTGFVTDDDKTHGCSPDGFVNDDGLIEIKCLKAESHISAIIYHHKYKKCPPKYVQQTQGQMMVTGRKWCDLMFYHPDLPSLVIRQERDLKLFRALNDAIEVVIEDRNAALKIIEEYSL
jgi:hypothetical protein